MHSEYIAHINQDTKKIQTVKEHSENVAQLGKKYAIPELKNFMYAVGLAHDIGKYQQSFVERINGSSKKVEHSTCGALVVDQQYKFPLNIMMEYCIAGHHTGLPNGRYPIAGSLEERKKRKFEDYTVYKEELKFPSIDFNEWLEFMMLDCKKSPDLFFDKFAFITRYVFSCLVDADSEDTAQFCHEGRLARLLEANFPNCLKKINNKLQSFQCKTQLQKTRSKIQQQAFNSAKEDANIYLMEMPTGSGKTLASIKIALERLIEKEKKRIIYIVAYNGIIDQTVDVLEKIGEQDLEILRHQSSYSYEENENLNEDYREAAKQAIENWSAPVIVTTAVQFFESLHSNKRGKLRKLHNMSDSILIFDEAHLMPREYLQPCLQAIAYITKYLNSEAIFLTATMPDYEKLIKEYTLDNLKIINLIRDTSDFQMFQKCHYRYIGTITKEMVIEKGNIAPSRLIIVNTRKKARKLFEICTGEKYHLSTYMTMIDRRKILSRIKERLLLLEKDFPDGNNVPDDRKITIISTSLIEAGVDLDVHTVFRELSSLDSILQAGGRCNREGKREYGDVFIFCLEELKGTHLSDFKENLTKGLIEKYSDISNIECIKEYYERLFFMEKEKIQQYSMHEFCKNGYDLQSISFKEYAEQFKIIDSLSKSLVIMRDEESKKLIEELKYGKTGNIRKLQNYTCSVYENELNELIKQHVVADFGTGIYCLENNDYYDPEIGIIFEAKDYYLE